MNERTKSENQCYHALERTQEKKPNVNNALIVICLKLAIIMRRKTEREEDKKERQKKKRRRKKDGDHHRNKTRGFMLELNDGNSTYIHTVVTSVSRAYHSWSEGK